jgi:Uma2 family endonuclease
MSIVPDRRKLSEPGKSKVRPARGAPSRRASFAYGYREMTKRLPDGGYVSARIPLTLEDVLHPRFGNVHMLGDPHGEDCGYLKDVLKARYFAESTVAVLSDCGIYWDIAELAHHCPDIAVIFGVRLQKDWDSFDVKAEGVRPILIIEVSSLKTRVNDVKTKVKEYARAGVLHYIIADNRTRKGEARRLELYRYQLKGRAYECIPLDEQGRAWLEPVGLWLATTINPATGGARLVLVDPATNQEIRNYTSLNQELTRAEARIRQLEEQLRRQKKRRS